MADQPDRRKRFAGNSEDLHVDRKASRALTDADVDAIADRVIDRLTERLHTPTRPAPAKPDDHEDRSSKPGAYLTVADAARALRCDQKTVRRAITAGELKASRPARHFLILEEDLTAWVESYRVTQSPRPAGPRAPRATR